MPEPLPDLPDLRDLLLKPPARPTLDAFVDHFFLIAGSPAAVARMLFDEFRASAPGSLVRQRILDLVLKSVARTDAANKGLTDDYGVLSDDDLVRAVAGLQARVRPEPAADEPRPAAPVPPPVPDPAAAGPPGPPPPA